MEKVIKDKLWTPSFCAVAAGNFLLFFANYRYAPGEADDIDRETAAITLDQNGLLGRRRLKKTALPAN